MIKIFGKKSLNPIKLIYLEIHHQLHFLLHLTLLNKNSKLKIKNVGINQTRIGFYKLLKKQGAKIKFEKYKKRK